MGTRETDAFSAPLSQLRVFCPTALPLPSSPGEFMFGNSHRLYFMVWVSAVTIYYFDRGLLLDISIFGASISLVHALLKNPDTQWESGAGGSYSPVGDGSAGASANDTI